MVVELECNLNIWYIYKGGLSDHSETLVMGNEMLVSGERGVREQVGRTRTWQTKQNDKEERGGEKKFGEDQYAYMGIVSIAMN